MKKTIEVVMLVTLAGLMSACGGGGGPSAVGPAAPPTTPPVTVAPAPVVTPIAVQSSSYANAKAVAATQDLALRGGAALLQSPLF